MNCKDWEERIALAAGGDAAAAEAAAVERHVAKCAGCQVFSSGLKQSLELLREAHGEPVDEAYFAAVRARVLSELIRAQVPWWRRGWVYGCVLAAAAAILMVAIRPAAKVERAKAVVKPVEVAVQAAAVQPTIVPQATRRVAGTAAVRHRRRTASQPLVEPAVQRPAAEPLIVKLLTDDPDVVIYWIADGKGDRP